MTQLSTLVKSTNQNAAFSVPIVGLDLWHVWTPATPATGAPSLWFLTSSGINHQTF